MAFNPDYEVTLPGHRSQIPAWGALRVRKTRTPFHQAVIWWASFISEHVLCHGRFHGLNGANGSYTNTDDVKGKKGQDKRNLGLLGGRGTGSALDPYALVDRLVSEAVKSYTEGLVDRTAQMGGTLVSRQYPRKPAPAQAYTTDYPKIFPSDPTPKVKATKVQSKVGGAGMSTSFTVGGGSGRPITRTVRYEIDVGSINTPPTGTPFATLTGYMTPHPSYGQYYEDSRGYGTVQVLEANVELIPNDIGPKENITNGRWLVVGGYSEVPAYIPAIGQARCFAPTETAIFERNIYRFTSSRLNREVQIPTGAYTNTYENTPGTFVIGVLRPSGSGVTDYAPIGRWRLNITVKFMDPVCVKERYGRVYATCTGASGTSPVGTTITSFGAMGHLRGSSLDVTNRKLTIAGTMVGDYLSFELHSDGTAAAINISTGNTLSGLTAANLTFNNGAVASSFVVGQSLTSARAVAKHFYSVIGDSPYIIVSAANTWPTAATVTIECNLIGVNINETTYVNTIYSVPHGVHLCPSIEDKPYVEAHPEARVIDVDDEDTKCHGVTSDDVCPAPDPEIQEPDLEAGAPVMVYPLIEDEDLASEIESMDAGELRALIAAFRAGRIRPVE